MDTKIIKLADLPKEIDNVFEFEKPDTFVCTIWTYQAGHSVMIVKLALEDIDQSSKSLFICFEAVEYFEGAMKWPSSNFRIETSNDCAILLRKLNKYNDFPSNFLPQHLCLVTSNNKQVKLIASKVTITTDLTLL